MKPIRFGTDGIRGPAYEAPLDAESVRRIGTGLAEVLGAGRRVLIGGDTRRSTADIAAWLAEGLGSDIDAVWLGVLPTPAISHLVRSGDFDAGAVVSASHNPAADNGLKILGSDGEKLLESTEARLELAIEAATPRRTGRLPEANECQAEEWTSHLLAGLEGRTLEGMRLVIDGANGAGSFLAGNLFRSAGAEVVEVFCSPDGNNINAGCGATATAALAEAVLEHGADGGLALDGDGDRVMLATADGRILDGDDMLLAWGLDLAARGRLPGDIVVATVMSNLGLELALDRKGLELRRAQVGDRWVWQEMKACGAVLGGEQSGHVICRDIGVTGDGLATALHLLALAAQRGSVADLSDLERVPQRLINLDVARKPPLSEIDSFCAARDAAADRLGKEGRILVRYSGTESMVRVMVEGLDSSLTDSIAEELSELLRHEIGA